VLRRFTYSRRERRRSTEITVKTGLSLSTIRAQTSDMGRIIIGLTKNEPTKTTDRTNLNKLGENDEGEPVYFIL
jgi:hypothetical protein